MKIESIVGYLQEQMGMNPETVGFDTMKKAVYTAMLANDINDLDEYYLLIQQDSLALQGLIDAVVIPETSFFRDKKPFQVLKNNLRHLHRTLCDEGEPLKVLSVPSSTGEEPYSIAMTCLDAGLDYGEFEIHACDISQRVLDVARRGQYSEYSFRGGHTTYQQRYFTPQGHFFQIDEQLRASVNFFQGNLIGDQFMGQVEKGFHIVFCRNLLIYFDKPTKCKAISVIESLLHDDGLLVVGHADTAILPNLGYKPFSDQFSFTYVKSHNQQKAVVSTTNNHVLVEKGKQVMEALVAARTDIAASSPVIIKHNEGRVPSNSSTADIAQKIEALLLKKDFSQATTCCQTLMDKTGDKGMAHHYLGHIAFLQGEMQVAEKQFKRAVYLQPNNEEALCFLAKISKKQGDEAAAVRYQQRADRIKARISSAQENL